jgi:hypothetical protein
VPQPRHLLDPGVKAPPMQTMRRDPPWQVAAAEVSDNEFSGDKASLAAVIAGQQIAVERVSGFVCKWRTMRNKDSNLYLFEVNI